MHEKWTAYPSYEKKKRQDEWIQAIRRGKDKYQKQAPTSKYSYVCRSHFTDDDYVSVTFHGKYTTSFNMNSAYLFPFSIKMCLILRACLVSKNHADINADSASFTTLVCR